MAMNFNVGKINEIETEEENETPKKSTNDNDFKKRIILIGGIIIGGFIVLLVILWIASLFTTRSYSYEEIEKILKESAISYFDDHKKNLPNDEDQLVEINASTLASYEYMKDMSEYTKEGTTCTGKVVVQKVGDEFSYTPYLSCGKDYVTKNLYQVITKETVDVDDGLYKVGNEYIFRGENINNYLKLDEELWRIVKVTSDNRIVLVLDGKYTDGYSWDNRYNQDNKYNAGINDYKASRIRTYLDEVYKDNSDYKILSVDDRTKLSKFDLCIGKRSTAETTKDNTVECGTILNDQKMGLLTVSDYINASLDVNCTNTINRSCQNYNYLGAADFDWWLATAVDNNTNGVYIVTDSGAVEEEVSAAYASVRPIIYLNEDVLFKSGKGTEEKPYKIK